MGVFFFFNILRLFATLGVMTDLGHIVLIKLDFSNFYGIL